MASRAAILRAAAPGAPGAAQPTYPPQGGSPWIGQLPSYSVDPEAGFEYRYGPFLPRPGSVFTEGAFGPMSPILPVPVDRPGPGLPRPQPRRWQPYVGYNLPVGAPGTEGYKLASFATLKTLSESYSILRTCLNIRKDEIRALEWDITLTPEAAKAYQGDKAAMRDFGERRAKALKFFKRPDPNYFNFSSWLYALLEQVFTYDAASLYMCPKKGRGMGKGLLGSDLDSLWLIDGPSIRPLMGLHGEVPEPPAPAFQQYEYGVPRADLVTMAEGMDLAIGEQGRLLQELHGDQLIYYPYFWRADSPYGFSLVEQAIIPIMTGLQKQAFQLDFFKETTVPRVYISPGDANMTPNQIRELQDALNATAGDLSWAFKIQVLPPGSKVMPQKEMAIVDQADEWIAAEVSMVCGINPMEIGILPKVSTVASPFAAREMAQANRSIHERTATKPTLTYLTSIFDMILQTVCGQQDMRFIFDGMEQTQDMAALADRGVKLVQSGLKSIDEVRDEMHMTPWGGIASEPMVFTQNGPLPLAEAAAMAQAVISADGERTGAHSAAQGHVAASPNRKALPPGTSGQGRLNGAVTQRQARRGGALAPAHSTAEGAPGHSGGKPPVKAAVAEIEALGRHLAKGMDPGDWVTEHIPGVVMAQITEDLSKGLSARYVTSMAAAVLKASAGTGGAGTGQPPTPAQIRQQIQALAAQYQTQITAAFNTAIVQAQALIAQWMAGILSVTAAVLAGMIANLIREALLAALTALWTAAWNAGVKAAGGNPAKEHAALEAWLATVGRNWAETISGTGMKALLKAIRRALRAGDVKKIIAQMRKILNVAERAPMIAQTEVDRAFNAGELAAMKAAGVAWKVWVTRNDSRVCPVCMGNQRQGPVAITAAFASGALRPPQHPRCRCHIAPWTPPKQARKTVALRREVGLNGQEFWTDADSEPDFSGGRVFQPHDVEDIQVPQGGVPGASAGGEPPRWDGSEPVAYVERAPDSDDDAAYGSPGGIGARPGTYWPATYMDGYWPSPHGHGMTQPPATSIGAQNGRAPNAAGKRRKAQTAARFLRGAKTVPASVVYDQLRQNFPPEALGWVRKVRWVGPVEMPLDLIDWDGQDSWAADHQTSRVTHFARRLKAGKKVDPSIMVVRPGHDRARIVDGHHRSLACKRIGWPSRAYVGFITDATAEDAWQTHSSQIHQGDDPQNKSFTAGNLGLPGNVSGLVPLALQGQRTQPYVAGLAVRAGDTGRILMLQRAITEDDDAAGHWELPGGHAEAGEDLLAAAVREWEEETGLHLPPTGHVRRGWTGSNGIYEGFVMDIPSEDDLDLGGRDPESNPDGDAFEAIAWWDLDLAAGNPAVRAELRADWHLLTGALSGSAKSAKTPELASTHRPLGPHGLWHTPDKKHPSKENLPDYIGNVAHALERDHGYSESHAVAAAIETVKEWASGTAFGGKQKVTPTVQRAAKDAIRQWEKLRAEHAGG